MFRAIILISFFICLAKSATTEVKQPPVTVVDNGEHTLWTDLLLKEPSALITVKYTNNRKVTTVTTPGTTLEKLITGPAPKLSWQLENNAKYTMAMIDPDAPSRKESTKRSWLHWLAVNLDKNTIPHEKTLVHYNGPTPPKGSGKHRYVFFVFKQIRDFDSKVQSEISNKFKDNASTRGGFNIKSFVEEHGLGDAVAYNFFETETK